jgi:phage pi2 protein 07
MSDIKSRIKTIEKKIIPEPVRDISNMVVMVDTESDGKQYYTDKEGIKHLFKREDFSKNALIVTFMDYKSTTGGK